MDELKCLVDELVYLNDENLAQRVILNNDVQWCLSELQDILSAEDDGRVVYLPCKVGYTVYRLQYIEETPGRFVVGVAEIKFALIWLEEFGKTVFLTRKQAEAALKGENDGRC